ncbi:MAG TPA: helix-turn-helix transcriptional regulator [Staphylococcus saprophyticus]|nr:helix-turn-helix transcriptional regulator [Staphylococcus saprophyticus]
MDESVNEYVKEIRMQKGVTQSLLSKQTGISLSLMSKFDNNKCNISNAKLSKIMRTLSSNREEFKEHDNNIYRITKKHLIYSNDSYGINVYDLSDIDKLAKTFTFKDKKLTDSDMALIKQLAQALSDKN